MMRQLVLAGVALAALSVSVQGQTRPRDPFVFRTAVRAGDLNGAPLNCAAASECKNRLVAVLLNAQMTALYSTESGTLYLTRNGLPQNGNDTYSHTQYGQRLQWPASGAGTTLHRSTVTQGWELMQGGSPVASTIVYKGFNLAGNIVSLKWRLVAGATAVDITEMPEYASVGGSPGLTRTVVVNGLGSGQSLRLNLSGQVRPETWTVQSGGTLEGTSPVYLNIAGNGTAIVTGSWTP